MNWLCFFGLQQSKNWLCSVKKWFFRELRGLAAIPSGSGSILCGTPWVSPAQAGSTHGCCCCDGSAIGRREDLRLYADEPSPLRFKPWVWPVLRYCQKCNKMSSRMLGRCYLYARKVGHRSEIGAFHLAGWHYDAGAFQPIRKDSSHGLDGFY